MGMLVASWVMLVGSLAGADGPAEPAPVEEAAPLPQGPSGIPEAEPDLDNGPEPEDTAPQSQPPPAADPVAADPVAAAPVATRVLAAAMAAGTGFAVLAVGHGMALALTTVVAAPLLGVALASAGEGNPWFAAPFAAAVVPVHVGGVVAAGALATVVALGAAWLASRGVMGWRWPLAPALALLGAAATSGWLGVATVTMLNGVAAVGAVAVGTLIYAAYLEEATGQSPLTADRNAKAQAAPVLFLVGVGLGALASTVTALGWYGVGALLLGVHTGTRGRPAGNQEEEPWIPDVLPSP